MKSERRRAAHSSMSISPEPSSSRTSRAFLRRAGCSRNWRFSSPQFLRNLITSSSVFTAFTISAVDSVPPPSLSMSSKHFRAAFKKSPVNSAISRCAARASSSRFAARSASLFLSAISMHSSLRGTSTGELRSNSTPPARHRRVEGTPKVQNRRRNAPLVDVNMPVAVRVHRRERGLEAHRHEQVLQVFIPAVDEERDHFFIRRDGLDDFSFFQRPGLVDVDHFEALPRRVQKFDAKFGVGLLRRALAPLAFGGELREALRQAAVDGFLPCAHTDQ